MEREELEQKVNEELGSTKLTLSEQTISGELDDVLEDFGDDEEANSKIITRLVNRLKRLDGNLHKDVSTQVNDWKKKNPKPKPAEPKKNEGNEDEPAWFTKYKDEQEAKWKAQEEARKRAEQTEAKNAMRQSVEKSLKKQFKEAGVEANGYILKQVMGRLDIPDEGADAEKLTKDVEKAYYKDLKEAGLEHKPGKPRFGGGGGKGATAQDAYFQKQGWYKERHKDK